MLTYKLSRDSDKPMYLQLYEMIKLDITSGRLKAGERLPSKRALAEHIDVSVITVEYAYRCLAEEGYAYSRERSGWFVGDSQTLLTPELPVKSEPPESEQGEEDVEFPFSTYAKIARRVLSEYDRRLLVKSPHNGCLILRAAISDYLFRYRGITASAENIVIGSGAEYLYAMLVQLLGTKKIYGVEDPSYEKIRLVYGANGAKCELLKLDSSGIKSEDLKKTKARIIHVTPYKSYPTGVTASAAKRFEYIKWAQDTDSVIIEDDYSSEFSRSIKSTEPLFSMDRSGRVIYLNTFSKSLTPSIRIGYMVLPDFLAREYSQRLGFYSCTVPVFDQYILAEFINDGSFERHLNRKRRQLR